VVWPPKSRKWTFGRLRPAALLEDANVGFHQDLRRGLVLTESVPALIIPPLSKSPGAILVGLGRTVDTDRKMTNDSGITKELPRRETRKQTAR
jgi:hypothetical protein